MLDFMRKKQNSIIAYVLFGIIIIVFAISFGPSMDAPIGAGAQIVAEVGSENLSLGEYKAKYAVAFQSRQNIWPKFDTAMADKMGLKQQVLDEMVSNLVFSQFAKKLNFQVGDAELKDYLENSPNFKGSNGKFDPAFYEKIVNYYFRQSVGRFEERMRDEILAEKFKKLASNFLYISDDEMRFDYFNRKHQKNLGFLAVDLELASDREGFTDPSEEVVNSFIKDKEKALSGRYEERKPEFKLSERIKASHILISTKDGRSEEDALKLVNEIHAEISKNPADFERIAKEKSEDPGSKVKGGDLGIFGKGMMVPAFEKAAFELKPNELSKPVKSPFGYHIIKLVEKFAAKNQSFDDVKASLAKEMMAENDRENHYKGLLADVVEAIKKDKSLNVKEALPENLKGQEWTLSGETGLIPLDSQYFGALGSLPELKEDLGKFTEKNKYPLAFKKVGKYLLFAWLKEEQKGKEDEYQKQKESLRTQITNSRQRDFYTALDNEIRKNISVSVNSSYLKSTDN